ncbi:MAG: class I SAM-dependent methyltransferase [Anaerolineales bacterium]|nr:class I SAM-dependent methyltransferase [Anaerolineales bacterium]
MNTSIDPQEIDTLLWAHLKDLPYFRSILRTIEAAYFRNLDIPEPILDIGSGDGHFASVAFPNKINVGIDPWLDFNAHRTMVSGHKYLIQAEGSRVPVAEGYFSSAVSNSVLEHIEGINAVLVDTARVLKPGGCLYFSVPNPGYYRELWGVKMLKSLRLNTLAEKYRDWFERISLVYHADGPEVWEERLNRAGFELVESWNYFSPRALQAMERGHFWGVPSLIWQKLSKHWILVPSRWNLWLTYCYARRFCNPEQTPEGTFSFFIARRR